MSDYMRAIYQRFYAVSEEERTLDCQIDEIRRELSETMDILRLFCRLQEKQTLMQ